MEYVIPPTCDSCNNPPAPSDNLCYACRAVITPPDLEDILPAHIREAEELEAKARALRATPCPCCDKN